MAFFQGLDEIFQVVGQPLFFFVDIQLFDVVNQFLFQAVFVIIHFQCLLKSLHDALFDAPHTFLLIRLYFCQEAGNVGNLLAEFFLQRNAFLASELHQRVQGTLDSFVRQSPFFIRKLLHFVLGQDVGQAQKGAKPIGWLGDARGRGNFFNPLVIGLHQSRVDGSSRGGSFLFLYPQAKVHLAAFERARYLRPDFHLLFTIKRRDAGGQIQRLTVE